MRYTCLLLFCLLARISWAQGPYLISGIVGDSATQQPLSGASVVVDYERTTTGTRTDEQGRFSLNLSPGWHTVVVRHVGYVAYRTRILLREPTRLNVRLASLVSQLEEVVITSKGYDRTIRQPLLGVSQINISTIKRMPAALGEVDILRSLQLLPGVSSVGEAANGVNIRGGTTDQNLILLDDTPIFNPTHMFGLFSVFPPDAGSGLDLYKGNVPARYGGRAASVLDISLRNPSLEKVQLQGGISLVANRLTADLPLAKGNAGLLVSGRGAFNAFLLPLISPRLDGIQARFGEGVSKFFWRINNRHTLTAMGYLSRDVFQTGLVGSVANINATSTQYVHGADNAMVRWFYLLTPRLNLQTTAVFANYRPDIRSLEPSGNEVILRQTLRQRQIRSSLNYQLDNQELEFGLTAIHYRINPGELIPGNSLAVNALSTPIENGLESALYADYEANLREKLAVSVGLRYSHFGTLGPTTVRQYAPGALPAEGNVVGLADHPAGRFVHTQGGLEPRVGLRYSLGANSSLKLGYNLMRQYLQQVTNTTTPLPTARWKTADAYLPPQISQLISAGWYRNSRGSIYEVSAEAYWRATRNILDFRPGANFLLQPYPETQLLSGQGRAYGLELMLAKKKGELTGWVNYTYARTLNRVDAGPEFTERINGGDWYAANFDRPHTLNLSLNINQSRHHSFSFNFAYSSGRPYSAPEGFIRYQDRVYPYYNLRNQRRIPDYHRLDFAWTIRNPSLRPRRWEGSWTFTVYNLYGRRNAYSIFFRTENQATNPYRLAIFAAPIPSLTYNFTLK